MKDGLKKSNLVANGKLLKIKGQPLLTLSDVSTMTKFRAEQAHVAANSTTAELRTPQSTTPRLSSGGTRSL
jgi:hypothetical protein